ncbi:MAG TPA: primosomal protein N' [Bryobacteraceae bacterium]|nr:primosomal protein N' [Bryobacteraceae bacterium]
MPQYADVSLPVPLDRAFTYALPESLRHRVQPGCRVMAPFGARRLPGVVLSVHDNPPDAETREVLRLLDEEPALAPELISLGRWIATYYCAPLGEVLRAMIPLSGEIRKGKNYTLTEKGRDALRQLSFDATDDDPQVVLMRMLEFRSLSAPYLLKKLPEARNALRALEKKGFVQTESLETDRDPLRAPASRLRVELSLARPEGKLKKAERELLAYLELHPGSHNLKDLEVAVKNGGQAARALARAGGLSLKLEVSAPAWTLPDREPHILNERQQEAYDAIRAGVESREFTPFLLHGVTGSGKTEVYLRAIDAALAAGRSALLLVPEIALTPAMAAQFYQRFGDRVAILHSAIGDSERAEQWRRIRSGAAGVVVGTRSGVFAPVSNLGLLIVDEEHDGSYKQEENPRYNGRDVAVVRAQAARACVVLGSATPSLESRQNAEKGKYTLLKLPERVADRPMPKVEMIDMREEFLETHSHGVFSRRLLDEIETRLGAGEQTMVLLNRRGFSSFVACRSCGERIQCVNCAVTLTYHRRDRRLLCHYCNYAAKVPTHCPKCNSEHVYFLGTGSERVEDELHRHFPVARIARMDRDSVIGKRGFESILASFRAGEYDILVGTQMIAKGHDIPNVTLVGVVSADVGLGMPDFRAAERTFQLLTQVSGRAGRGNLPGLVLIQTINPDHYAVRLAAAQNYELFFEKEMQFRRAMRYPPFAALANVLVRSRQQEEAERMAGEIGTLLTPPPEGLKVLGPAEAPVPRLKEEYRYQVLIKAASRKRLREFLLLIRQQAIDRKWPATSLVIDVDPLSLM